MLSTPKWEDQVEVPVAVQVGDRVGLRVWAAKLPLGCLATGEPASVSPEDDHIGIRSDERSAGLRKQDVEMTVLIQVGDTTAHRAFQAEIVQVPRREAASSAPPNEGVLPIAIGQKNKIGEAVVVEVSDAVLHRWLHAELRH